ncbi:MAG TPA: sigma-54 dependent transcriptional regulator [Acidobacteriota bacterium]|nr:sigma-54 dependent transcriptional regulator [Acidobacteriota bacterium]
MNENILIIDDDPSIVRTLTLYFTDRGFGVKSAQTGEDGLKQFTNEPCDAVLLDIRLADRSGLDLLADFQKHDSTVPVVIMTAFHDMPTAVRAIKLGACEYIHKPIAIDELDEAVEKALALRSMAQRGERAFASVPSELKLEDLVGKSKSMLAIFKTIGMVSKSKTTVLVTGESGTGKELIARAIHDFTNPSKSFISVNCSALVETLLESELFGHEKGAFTGAHQPKPGKFELADQGTLFLDEVADMSPAMQVKLLRVLQERVFERVGGTRPIATDVRIIAATHQDLEGMVRRGQFREDLYYRLNVVNIRVPPLRERREDIPDLVHHLVNRINHELNRNVRRIPRETMGRLKQHEWRGNVRELENYLRRAVLMSQGDILIEQKFDLFQDAQPVETVSSEPNGAFAQLEEVEKEHIRKALEHSRGNKSLACRLLGISHPTLQRKIRKYGL